MNINLPNFNVKNLVKEAGSTISRVVQVGKYINEILKSNKT